MSRQVNQYVDCIFPDHVRNLFIGHSDSDAPLFRELLNAVCDFVICFDIGIAVYLKTILVMETAPVR